MKTLRADTYKAAAPLLLGASFIIALILDAIPVFGFLIRPWHIMLMFLAAVVILGIDKRAVAGLGVSLVAVYPALTALDQNLEAARFLLYAFYFIVAAVVLMIIEYALADEKNPGSEGDAA